MAAAADDTAVVDDAATTNFGGARSCRWLLAQTIPTSRMFFVRIPDLY